MLSRTVVTVLLLTVIAAAFAGCASTHSPAAQSPTLKRTPLPTDDGMPVNQWYMKTADGMTHYVAEYGVEAKPGNVVIVLHGGWGAEHSYLLPAVRPLANQYKFVLYDQRGSLRSPVRPPAKITYAALVEDLDQLRQRLGLEKVTLLAHSMGNHLAYGYLRAHPARVERLILVGATVPAPFGEERPMFLSDVWPDFADADVAASAAKKAEYDNAAFTRTLRIAADEGLIPYDAGSATPETVASFGLKEHLKTDQQKTEWWRIQFTCVNTHGGRNWREMLGGQSFYNPDVAAAVLQDPDYVSACAQFWPALKAFDGPIRVIIGTHDYVDLGPTMWPRLVARLPHAQLDTIPNAGHSIWMDEPALFARSLRSALQDTTTTGTRLGTSR